MEKNKVKLTICGVDYNILSDDDKQYISEVGKEVDKKITDTLSKNSRLSTTMAAILTSLEYCDIANKLKLEIKSLKEGKNQNEKNYLQDELKSANIKIEELEQKVDDLKRKVSSTLKENTELVQELSDSRLEIQDLIEECKKEETFLSKDTEQTDYNEDVLNFFDFQKNVESL